MIETTADLSGTGIKAGSEYVAHRCHGALSYDPAYNCERCSGNDRVQHLTIFDLFVYAVELERTLVRNKIKLPAIGT